MVRYIGWRLDGRKSLFRLLVAMIPIVFLEVEFEEGLRIAFENLVLKTIPNTKFGKLVKCMMGVQ